MKNQTSVNGSTSPELQPGIDPASKTISTNVAVAGLSMSTATTPADTVSLGDAPSPVEPDGVKIGHV
jgi:hypothetical protein